MILLLFLMKCECTAQNIDNYLRDSHCESLLAEEQRNGSLSEDSLDVLLVNLRDYIQKEYSLNISADELIEVCDATVQLFPSLESKTGRKIVI